ncbi:MAG TPA: cupredoxin domain-containing protein [Syntrophales bacterium]|nr:cupredoxin domain-containing protein [Syntrophales bacterium]HPI56527.1 cupredoxin domain-containing protein [Syntrophales bacterium]HPN25052.1 cupredoxin domain-containing protein [Syntrophales bacterium]HQM29205.1 cupredoxin domain-containing protein [Syntrophales bacterium]
MRYPEYLLVILSVLLLTCAGSMGAERKEFTASAGSDGVQRVDVTGGSYYFDPNYIIVKVNVPVEMKFRKESGIVPHDFTLKAPEAGMDVHVNLATEPVAVRFTPTKPGKYPFYCSKKPPFLESHRDKGMEGVLEVRE